MARFDLLGTRVALDYQAPPVNGLAPDCFVEDAAKRVVAQNGDYDRGNWNWQKRSPAIR
jgi:hypothetical protein